MGFLTCNKIKNIFQFFYIGIFMISPELVGNGLINPDHPTQVQGSV